MKYIRISWQRGPDTDALFGRIFQEAQVFEQYYAEGAYFRLQQAYLVYMSREYVVEERKNQQECDRYHLP